jgi:hypothetical protein
MTHKYCLTFDIDWAPDFAIKSCLDLLEEAQIKATFFATHSTPLNDEIRDLGHILGIHPNFLPNSSHGTTVSEIIETCLSIVPDAWCFRTHGLVQSTPLYSEIFRNFPQLKLDVSLLMHRSEMAGKCKWAFDGVEADRILFNWEDDAEFHYKDFGLDDKLFFGDLTVCNFHPIHIFLNSSDGQEYKNLKAKLSGMDFSKMKREEAANFVNIGGGSESHLKALLASQALPISLSDI